MWRTFILGSVTICLLLAAADCLAATKDWNDGSDNWSNAADWTPAGVPGAGDTANIVFADGVARTVTYDYTGPTVTLAQFNVDLLNPATNATTLSMAANALSVSSEQVGVGGHAVFMQSGGTHTVSGDGLFIGSSAGASGQYFLDGGALITNNETVGAAGTGSFDQGAGSNTVSNTLRVGGESGAMASGTYNLSGSGQLAVGNKFVLGDFGTGIVNQQGGSATITGGGGLTIGSALGAFGLYTLSSGTLTVNSSEYVGFSATGNGVQAGGAFIQNGGTHKALQLVVGTALGSTGTYTLSGGSLVTMSNGEYIGVNGSGSFFQSGGAHTSTSDIVMGDFAGSSGTYTMSGGAMTAPNVFVGGSSNGAGGTGSLSVFGTNTMVTVPGTISVFNTPGSGFSLTNGTVNVGGINLNGTPSLFSWSNGTLNITNDVTWDSAAAATSTSSIFGSSLSLSSGKSLRIIGNETIGGSGLFNLSVGSGAHSVTGNITLKPGGTISVSTTQPGSAQLNYTTFTQAGGTIASPGFRNSSNFVYQSGNITGPFVNDGTITFGPSMSISGTFQNNTSMTVASNQTFNATSGITNNGAFTLAGGAIGGSNGSFVNTVGGTLIAHGTVSGQLVNHGTMIIDGLLTLPSSAPTNDGVIQGAGTLSSGSAFSNMGDKGAAGTINATSPGGTLAFTNFSSNPLGGIVNVGPTSTLSMTASNSWTNSGIVNLQGAGARLIGSSITNNGTIQGFGTVTSSIATSNSGIIRASGGELDFTAGNLTNSSAAQIQILSGSTASFLQGLSNNSGLISLIGGTFDTNGKTMTNGGTINGFGTLRTGGLTISSQKLLSVGEGDMNVFGNVTNNGVISIQGGRSAYFFNNVNGSGSFTGTGTAVFLATLSPGNSPASVSFAGSATLGGGTSLAMELGGTVPGTGYDQIHVAGQLAIGGALSVSLINGFKPAAGNSFDLLDWGTLAGTFSSLSLPTLAVGNWDTSRLYTDGVLSVVLAGDFNHDNKVDAADYVTWRKGLGTIYTQNDYDVWRAHLGEGATGGGSGAAVAVPEPSYALMLLALGLAGRLARRR